MLKGSDPSSKSPLMLVDGESSRGCGVGGDLRPFGMRSSLFILLRSPDSDTPRPNLKRSNELIQCLSNYLKLNCLNLNFCDIPNFEESVKARLRKTVKELRFPTAKIKLPSNLNFYKFSLNSSQETIVKSQSSVI